VIKVFNMSTIMYGPNFQPNFSFPVDDQRWYEQLPTRLPIDIPCQELQRNVQILTERVQALQIENNDLREKLIILQSKTND